MRFPLTCNGVIVILTHDNQPPFKSPPLVVSPQGRHGECVPTLWFLSFVKVSFNEVLFLLPPLP